MKYSKSLSALLIFCSLTFSACAPHLGATIETPEVPLGEIKTETRARLGSFIAMQGLEDRRPAPSSEIKPEYTQPAGPVTETVEAALRDAFKEHGITVLDTAPVGLKAEIREWKSKVKVQTNTAIESKAVLAIELFDPTGKRIYSGTYEGSRSSQFPVVNRIDVKDSLGLAMANCISHILDDPKVMEIIGSY